MNNKTHYTSTVSTFLWCYASPSPAPLGPHIQGGVTAVSIPCPLPGGRWCPHGWFVLPHSSIHSVDQLEKSLLQPRQVKQSCRQLRKSSHQARLASLHPKALQTECKAAVAHCRAPHSHHTRSLSNTCMKHGEGTEQSSYNLLTRLPKADASKAFPHSTNSMLTARQRNSQ